MLCSAPGDASIASPVFCAAEISALAMLYAALLIFTAANVSQCSRGKSALYHHQRFHENETQSAVQRRPFDSAALAAVGSYLLDRRTQEPERRRVRWAKDWQHRSRSTPSQSAGNPKQSKTRKNDHPIVERHTMNCRVRNHKLKKLIHSVAVLAPTYRASAYFFRQKRWRTSLLSRKSPRRLRRGLCEFKWRIPAAVKPRKTAAVHREHSTRNAEIPQITFP
jgi:hypothetical protein